MTVILGYAFPKQAMDIVFSKPEGTDGSCAGGTRRSGTRASQI
jgi:hypothetical protein